MNDRNTDLPALPPPAGNDDIERALADVDEKLSAWVSAMTGAEAALAQRCQPDETSAETPPRPDLPKTGGLVAATEAAAKQPVPPVSPAFSVAPPVEKPAKLPPSKLSAQPSPDDDAALLAALDPETAKAIRVMRRLSFEKKSVRELLEEYTKTQNAQGPAERRKKSWWSRG